MAYRFRIFSGEAQGGNVRMKVTVEKQAADGSWASIEDGTRMVTLGTVEVLAITNDEELTNQQKVAALAKLFRERVGAANLPLADEAAEDIRALIGSYPVTVNIP